MLDLAPATSRKLDEEGGESDVSLDQVIGGSINQQGSFIMRADKVASYFVPAVIVIAVIPFVVWSSFGPTPPIAFGLIAAVSVLIRDAEALERMEKRDTVVLDKTGTLTEGKPQVTKLVPAEGFSEEELMRLAGGLEKGSEHPLAHAILDKGRAMNLPDAEGFA